MYNLIKPFLFAFDPEDIHRITFKILPHIPKKIKNFYKIEDEKLNRNLFGINFPNPIGLAAGLDKNGEVYNHLSDFGFGFIEIGTITPMKQHGNEKPRLYRLLKDEALINRMGFNNHGVYKLIDNINKNGKNDIILGINVGKNKSTDNKNAYIDYIYCMTKLEDYADYFTINISSPNTPNLRDLQKPKELKNLLLRISDALIKKPVLLKVSPDINNKELEDIVKSSEGLIDGFVATNTTIYKNDINKKYRSYQGGLSGKPVKEASTKVIKVLNTLTDLPIIGSGGIMNEYDAIEKIESGADLIQIYTGLIYKGPKLIKDINKKILSNF